MRISAAHVVTLGFIALAAGCSDGRPVQSSVLRKGECVAATNGYGHVEVCYVDSLRRSYRWKGGFETVKMMERPEPFEGRAGLYEPAARFIFDPSRPRMVVEESVIDFKSTDEIYKFLWPEHLSMDWVYTDTGLIVGFGGAPQRNQINVDVFQARVNGKPVANLSGARGQNVTLTTGN